VTAADLGRLGEDAAERFLRAKGMGCLARRFRIRRGEVDLVMENGNLLVFVEVKTRLGDGFGRPAESVGPDKRKRLARAAEAFLAGREEFDRPCRFDVVEVEWDRFGGWRISHIEDAFRLWPTG
jgi:putative endonuclease